MKVIDSTVWLETAVDGPLAERCALHLTDATDLITPTIVMLEVYRVLRRREREKAAMTIVAEMEYTRIVPLDHVVAIAAADLSIDHGLAAADAVVYATARLNGADLVTADTDFRGLPGVILLEQ